jgi:hypothetical protein
MAHRIYFAATHTTNGVATTSDTSQPGGPRPGATCESIGEQSIGAIVINREQVRTTGELTALLAKLTSIVGSDTKLQQLYGVA